MSNLEQVLIDNSLDYHDAEILVEGIPVGINQGFLDERNSFFNEFFKQEKGCLEKDRKPNYLLSDLLPFGKVGYEAFLVFLSYLYIGKLYPPLLEVSTCVDNQCAHDACGPAIDFAVDLMYASSIFNVPELVVFFQRRLANFVDMAYVEDVSPIFLAAVQCLSVELEYKCVDRISRSDNMAMEKAPPNVLPERTELSLKEPMHDDKQISDAVRRIRKALDLDDVDLVRLFLIESDVTSVNANSLHHVVAYSDCKVVSDVLDLGLVDANLRNSQGYTALHIAAIRREPSIIVSLLGKGACVSDLTLDGRSALNICQRLTRKKDYHAKIDLSQETNKDRLCIDILEGAMRRNLLAGDAFTSQDAVDDTFDLNL
ncbi:hypothetical protein P3X46_033790 [Hevea brasiliensis]|uniref:BTB domain-containing protein n=1 Tax=Hevea brasiliensis TaxID=3981 RepID=A0ABQ9KBC5_HEVBR|nr:hypothetical protein P3X46_033790 [Hevea brasiliensis]